MKPETFFSIAEEVSDPSTVAELKGLLSGKRGLEALGQELGQLFVSRNAGIHCSNSLELDTVVAGAKAAADGLDPPPISRDSLAYRVISVYKDLKPLFPESFDRLL